jgi:hypothetical protein
MLRPCRYSSLAVLAVESNAVIFGQPWRVELMTGWFCQFRSHRRDKTLSTRLAISAHSASNRAKIPVADGNEDVNSNLACRPKSAKGSQVRPVGLPAGLVSSIVPLWYPHERLVRLLNGRIGFCRIPRAGCQAAPINRRWPLWGRMTSSYSPRPPRQRSRRVEDDEERYDTEICARPYFVRLGL